MKNDRLKSILGIPYFLFLVIFVVCPVLILLYYALPMERVSFLLRILHCFLQTVKQSEL